MYRVLFTSGQCIELIRDMFTTFTLACDYARITATYRTGITAYDIEKNYGSELWVLVHHHKVSKGIKTMATEYEHNTLAHNIRLLEIALQSGTATNSHLRFAALNVYNLAVALGYDTIADNALSVYESYKGSN